MKITEKSKVKQKNEIQRCLVLGANGFIGSHVVDRLAKNNVRVRAFDRFRREPQFHPSALVEAYRGDIQKDDDLDKALQGSDYLIHCLSATTPFVADADPYADIRNLLRTVEVFERAIHAGVRKIAFVSSGGAVYGRSAEGGIATESAAPLPVSPYGICKLTIEHYLEYFKRKYGTEYIVYRLSNPYGPRQVIKQSQGVIPTFLNKILQNEPITIFGDGTMSRDYIYIEDAAAMIADTFHRPNKYPAYNVGSGQQVTLNEIVAALKEFLHKEIRIEYMESPKTFLHRTDISIHRFCEEFGEPVLTSFEKGLAATVRPNVAR
jgi:UDP-glucose 4-epimerase